MRFILAIIVLIFFPSCKNKFLSNLTGKWELDSCTGPGTKLFRCTGSSMTLNKDGTFEYSREGGDVASSYEGNFFIRDSVDDLKTLDLVADRSDFHYTIVEISDKRLKITSKESYTTGDSAITFTRTELFKKE